MGDASEFEWVSGEDADVELNGDGEWEARVHNQPSGTAGEAGLGPFFARMIGLVVGVMLLIFSGGMAHGGSDWIRSVEAGVQIGQPSMQFFAAAVVATIGFGLIVTVTEVPVDG